MQDIEVIHKEPRIQGKDQEVTRLMGLRVEWKRTLRTYTLGITISLGGSTSADAATFRS